MLPDRVSNPGPLSYESGAQPIALRGPATLADIVISLHHVSVSNIVILNSLWWKLVLQFRIYVWRNQTEIDFHSNRSGKISLFYIENNTNINITPKKQIISYWEWTQPQ